MRRIIRLEVRERLAVDEEAHAQLAILLPHEQLLARSARDAREPALLVVDDEGVDLEIGAHAVQRLQTQLEAPQDREPRPPVSSDAPAH